MNMFSPPSFYLNDTIQEELDNYSYHASFESNQAELNYANSNFLMLNEDLALPQLGLTPKKWLNQPNSLNHRTQIGNSFGAQAAVQSDAHLSGERKAIHARRFLPFTSLAERNTQSVSTGPIGTSALLTGQPFIIRKRNIDNLRIIRPNSSYLSHDANHRPKDAALSNVRMLDQHCWYISLRRISSPRILFLISSLSFLRRNCFQTVAGMLQIGLILKSSANHQIS